MRTDIKLTGKSKPTIIAVCLIFSLILGFIDYLTGDELRIDVFYLIPISMIAWYINQKTGIMISVLCTLLIFVSDVMVKANYHLRLIDIWNIIMILAFFIIVTVLLSKLRMTLLERTELVQKLQTTLATVKELSGILPICANCKKIRTDEGYWQQLEEYISSHTHAEFSHGLCAECAAKLYPDYFKKKT